MEIYIDKQGEPRRVDGKPSNMSQKDRKELKRMYNFKAIDQQRRPYQKANK